MSTPTAGHRQRLRDRFCAGEGAAHSAEGLLELLLTYAIPRKDVRPVARALLERFGSLDLALHAPADALEQVPGMGFGSATLLRLVAQVTDTVANARPALPAPTVPAAKAPAPNGTAPARNGQGDLFALDPKPAPAVSAPAKEAPARNGHPPEPPAPLPRARQPKAPAPPRARTGLFNHVLMEDTLRLAPTLPDTTSLDEVRAFLRARLSHNSAGTRQRYAAYIARRMFPAGVADAPFRHFAARFADTQALRDVCFYRLLRAEPLMAQFVADVLWPATGRGQVPRASVREYLKARFPAAKDKTVATTDRAIAEALGSAQIAQVERGRLTFSLRVPSIEAFAFVLHSELPEPGIYDLSKVEEGATFRALLWRPDRLLPALYELRNRGLLSKVSEIDSVRQLSTRHDLAGLVRALLDEGGPP